MTIRRKSKKVLSLLLGGMLMFATPLQTFAEDEPQTENPTEEVSAEETPVQTEVQETVPQPETPAETAPVENMELPPVVEATVQPEPAAPAPAPATPAPATPEPTAVPAVVPATPVPAATTEPEKVQEAPVATEAAKPTVAPVATAEPKKAEEKPVEKAEAKPTAEPSAKTEAAEKATAALATAEPTENSSTKKEEKQTVEKAEEKAAPTPETEDVKKEAETEEKTEEKEEKDSYQGAQKLKAVTAAGISVQADFEAGTFGEENLPEIRVKDLSDKAAVASAKKAMGDQEITEAKSVDISFYVDGKEVQPVDGQNVSLKIDLPASLNPDGSKGKSTLIHEHDGKAEVVNTAKVSASEASFQTDSFSTFTITWTSDRNTRAELTVHYVNQDGTEIAKPNVKRNDLTGNSNTVSFTGNNNDYINNDINGYRYYRTYIKVDDEKIDITSVRFERTGYYYGENTYKVRYLDGDTEVYSNETRTNDGVIRNDIYVDYHTIFSGEHDASVYFLLTPTSNANSNDTSHWNSNTIATGIGNARVNLTDATFTDNKNIIRNTDNNGDLSKYIVKWPDGEKGSTWTINKYSELNGKWADITKDVAEKYQAELRRNLNTTATVTADDITSITVTPYKISINNGNVSTEHGQTEVIHIDCLISVVCSKAYHYAFVVNYPSGSDRTDGIVKEGDKMINNAKPEAITQKEMPLSSAVPATLRANGVNYEFDGWYRSEDHTGNRASFAYQPTQDEITRNDGTITFYARYNQTTRNIHVRKVWNDQDNQDGFRPNEVTVALLQNGQDTGNRITLESGNDWEENFTVPFNSNGYSVKETSLNKNYMPAVSGNEGTGFTITNTHTPDTTDITVTKTWDDGNDQDGKRPSEITVRLRANGTEVNSAKVKNTENWKHTFNNLPKYANGREIEYTVTEDHVEGYTTSVNNTNYHITNSYTPGKTSISVTKDWEDHNDQDGIRPNNVIVSLYADGKDTGKKVSLSEGNEWAATFTDLDEKKNGRTIDYTVKETPVDGYTSKVSGTAGTGYTITNTHQPQETSVTVTKKWEDNNNQDGKRPSDIVVRLLANGITVEDHKLSGDQKAETWSYKFEHLPKFAGGQEIVYSVTEDEVDDYSVDYNGFEIINSYTPGKTSVSVVKEWNDDHDQDGKRPDSVVVQLYRNGDNTGETVTLSDRNEWTDSFRDLDEYENGQKIEYTVKEENVADGYLSDVAGNAEEGFRIINTHEPETVAVNGTKTWTGDENSNDRPESITVRLHADGEIIQTQKVTAENEWKYTFDNLPKYNNGSEIVYSVTEDEVDNYAAKYDGWNIVNRYTPGKTSITVTKEWDDDHDQDGIRPNEVTVRLYKDGKETDQTVTLTKNNLWTDSFENVDIDGDYTVKEENVADGYESMVSGDRETGFIITNAHTSETMKIQGTKTWKDNQNKDGKRPSVITIRLFAGDDEIQFIQVSGDLKADTWAYEFTDVPKYKNGKKVSYTVSEDAVDDYYTEVNGYDLINTLTSGSTDPSDQENLPPADKKEEPKQEEKVPAKTEEKPVENKENEKKNVPSDSNNKEIPEDKSDNGNQNDQKKEKGEVKKENNSKENRKNQVTPDTGDQFDQKKYGVLLLAGLIVIIGTVFRMIRDRRES